MGYSHGHTYIYTIHTHMYNICTICRVVLFLGEMPTFNHTSLTCSNRPRSSFSGIIVSLHMNIIMHVHSYMCSWGAYHIPTSTNQLITYLGTLIATSLFCTYGQFTFCYYYLLCVFVSFSLPTYLGVKGKIGQVPTIWRSRASLIVFSSLV